jgi:hypothetical protein
VAAQELSLKMDVTDRLLNAMLVRPRDDMTKKQNFVPRLTCVLPKEFLSQIEAPLVRPCQNGL